MKILEWSVVSTQNAARNIFIDTSDELFELTTVAQHAAATWDSLFEPDCVTVIVPQSTFQLSATTYTMTMDAECIKATRVDANRRSLPFSRTGSSYRIPMDVDDVDVDSTFGTFSGHVRNTRAHAKTNRGMALWNRRPVDDDGKVYPFHCPFEVVKNVIREVRRRKRRDEEERRW